MMKFQVFLLVCLPFIAKAVFIPINNDENPFYGSQYTSFPLQPAYNSLRSSYTQPQSRFLPLPGFGNLKNFFFPNKLTLSDIFQLKRTVKNLDTIIATIKRDAQTLRNKVEDLRDQAVTLYNDLVSRIEALERDPECPTSATNGKVVGTKCYTVNAGRLNLDDARTACGDQGGILAEPPVASEETLGSFVNNLYAVFGDDFGLSQSPIIGVTETAEADVFQYDSSGLLVSNNLLTVTDNGAENEVAAINLNLDNRLVVVSVDTPRTFICQFELV